MGTTVLGPASNVALTLEQVKKVRPWGWGRATRHPRRSARPNISAVARAVGAPASGSAPPASEAAYDVVLALEDRAGERGLPPGVEPVGVRAAVEEQTDRGGVAVVGGEHEDGVAVGVGVVDREPAVEVARQQVRLALAGAVHRERDHLREQGCGVGGGIGLGLGGLVRCVGHEAARA